MAGTRILVVDDEPAIRLLCRVNLQADGFAVQEAPDGGTVTVRVRKRRRVVELRVSDEGIGISERDQRNLFQKFFRVDAAMSRGIRGIGLGLYLVRGFVTAMGGRIWVESEQGKGSTFVVELPASEAPASSSQRREVA